MGTFDSFQLLGACADSLLKIKCQFSDGFGQMMLTGMDGLCPAYYHHNHQPPQPLPPQIPPLFETQTVHSQLQPSGKPRAKRMRTSFKHHQLRTMKAYFAINQNPDAKDLKQLAIKTCLSKRVLQVWFQNARAKWRRNISKGECISQTDESSPIMLPIGSSPPIGQLHPHQQNNIGPIASPQIAVDLSRTYFHN